MEAVSGSMWLPLPARQTLGVGHQAKSAYLTQPTSEIALPLLESRSGPEYKRTARQKNYKGTRDHCLVKRRDGHAR